MRDDGQRLRDILYAIRSIEKDAAKRFDGYVRDELIQVWILHHIQIIGEAASNLSSIVKEQFPDVAWQDVVAMRNVLVHQYFGVDLQEVWDTVTSDLPILKTQDQAILKAFEANQ